MWNKLLNWLKQEQDILILKFDDGTKFRIWLNNGGIVLLILPFIYRRYRRRCRSR